MACKDVMATYVMKLLELDESKQRATLDSLSKYAESKCLDANRDGDASPEVGPAPAFQGLGGIETPPGLGPDSSLGLRPPMKVEPRGLVACDWSPDAKAANCLPTVLRSYTKPSPPAVVARAPVVNAPPDYGAASNCEDVIYPEYWQRKPLVRQAHEVPPDQQVPSDHAIPLPSVAAGGVDASPDGGQHHRIVSLQKALNNLVTSLTPGAAVKAHKLLSIMAEVNGQSGSAPAKQGEMESMKWLMQHLQKQQEASVQKLSQYMQAEQSNSAMLAGTISWSARGGENWTLPGVLGAEAQKAAWGFTTPLLPNTFAYPLAATGLWANGNPTTLQPQVPMNCSGGLAQVSTIGGLKPVAPCTTNTNGFRRRGLVTTKEVVPSVPPAAQQAGETLRMHLQSLLNVEHTRVLLVRKINRLGFASPQLLEEHYSWYGPVERVLAAHSRVKAGPKQGSNSRLRPAGLGFVVMCRSEDAQAILRQGLEQVVQGVVVRVQQFECRMSDMADAEEGEEEEEVLYG